MVDILRVMGISDLYDIVFATKESEKPDKQKLIDNFVFKYGKPKYYISASGKESFEKCLSLGIICIYACWDDFDEEISKIVPKVVTNIKELEIENFLFD